MIINPKPESSPTVATPASPGQADTVTLQSAQTQSINLAHVTLNAITTTRAGRRELTRALNTLNALNTNTGVATNT